MNAIQTPFASITSPAVDTYGEAPTSLVVATRTLADAERPIEAGIETYLAVKDALDVIRAELGDEDFKPWVRATFPAEAEQVLAVYRGRRAA